MSSLSIPQIPCDTTIFVIYQGAIRQAIYRGFFVRESAMCNGGTYVYFYLYFGKEIGEIKLQKYEIHDKLYRSAEDAMEHKNRIPFTDITPQEFTNIYMKNTVLTYRGSGTFGAYAMSIDLEPTFYPLYDINSCVVRHNKVTDYYSYDRLINIGWDKCGKYFKTASECKIAYTPKVIMLD